MHFPTQHHLSERVFSKYLWNEQDCSWLWWAGWTKLTVDKQVEEHMDFMEFSKFHFYNQCCFFPFIWLCCMWDL